MMRSTFGARGGARLCSLSYLRGGGEVRGKFMLMCTSWKTRPIGAEAAKRMMEIWGKIEADLAANPAVERLCWYLYSDGSGGFTVERFTDGDAALAFSLESALALGEFFEIDTRPVHDLDSALPSIVAALERANA